MKIIILMVIVSSIASASDQFTADAPRIAQKLKMSLMGELQKKIKSTSVTEAIEFCHSNVVPIAKEAAGVDLKSYSFGRTSDKIRNPSNVAQSWHLPYLDKFKHIKASDKKAVPVVHTFPDGKRAYLEPLFVQPMCLNCHGSAISKAVQEKITSLYPNDQATGFKAGQFRGFIWVKEK